MSHRLTAPAEADLLAILLDGIDRFGVERAFGYRRALEEPFELVGEHPAIARLRNDIQPPLRVLIYKSHLILYDSSDTGGTTILRVRHCREDWVSDPL